MQYMKANVTINRFYAADGGFIGEEKSEIAFRNVEQLGRIIEYMKSHALETENIVIDIIVDSVGEM